RDLRQRARVRVRDRPRERDDETEVEHAPRHLRIAREAVHDSARPRDVLFYEDREGLPVGVATVNEHGLAEAPGEPELRPEGALLRVRRRQVPEEVEAG